MAKFLLHRLLPCLEQDWSGGDIGESERDHVIRAGDGALEADISGDAAFGLHLLEYAIGGDSVSGIGKPSAQIDRGAVPDLQRLEQMVGMLLRQAQGRGSFLGAGRGGLHHVVDSNDAAARLGIDLAVRPEGDPLAHRAGQKIENALDAIAGMPPEKMTFCIADTFWSFR